MTCAGRKQDAGAIFGCYRMFGEDASIMPTPASTWFLFADNMKRYGR